MDYREIKICRRVSLAVLPIDNFTDRIITDSSIEIKLENLNIRPLKKPDGYRVFTDLIEKEVYLVIDSSIYKTQRYKINLDQTTMEDRIFKVRMEPKHTYPAYSTGKAIKGRLIDKNNLPIGNKDIKIAVKNMEESLVCLNAINTGEDIIDLYNPKNKCLMGSEYAYIDNENIKGSVMLWEEVSDNKRYELKNPISFKAAKGKRLYKVFRLQTNENGDFDLLISRDYMKNESLLIIQYKEHSININVSDEKAVNIGNRKIEGE